MYTSNVYLVTGTNNTLSDVNTLIDVGRDPMVLEVLPNEYTGVGKRAVEQVIITHNHYDHTSMLKPIVERYHPRVCAFSHHLAGVDILLKDEDEFIGADQRGLVRLGDKMRSLSRFDAALIYYEKARAADFRR